MACTTILVGKKASYDGSTIMARNDDSPSGIFTPKKIEFHPRKQGKETTTLLFLMLRLNSLKSPLPTLRHLISTCTRVFG